MKSRFLVLFTLIMATLGLLAVVNAQDMMYNESPMLAERVEAGELPPVEERLPVVPRVIEVEGSDIGVYGGDFRDPFVGDAFWSSQMIYYISRRGLVNWNQDFSNWEANIAESVEVNEDATVYTFHLREGMKWSDGVPFTADDVLFAINDVMGNEEINGGTFPAGALRPGDTPPLVEKIDDYTFTITFETSYGMFLINLCGYPGWEMVTAPKHYLSQFHIDYNPDGIDALNRRNRRRRRLGNIVPIEVSRWSRYRCRYNQP